MAQTIHYSSQAIAQERSQSLVEAAKRDREGFARLYAVYAPPVFRYFWFHTRSRPVAEDLVSETFLNALRTLPTYAAERAPFNAWLFGLARRALARHIKDRDRRQDAEAGDPVQAPDGATRPAPLPEEHLDLWQAVSELTPSEREVVALKFGAELTHREIATAMGLREAHVGVVLYRALQTLRDRLAEGEEADAQ